MRLLTFEKNGHTGFGATDGRDVVDLTGRIHGAASLRALLEIGGVDHAREYYASAKPTFALPECRLLPLIPDAAKVICLAINYQGHAVESGRERPTRPIVFHRHAQTLIPHNAPMLRPLVSEQLDYEGELAVILGKRGGHVEPEDAMDLVAGYTCFNEGSVRDWQRHSHRFGMGKNFRATGAIGPWMVTKDEIPDPAELTLTTRLNGEQVQHIGLDQMLFSVAELISYVSRALDWLPGDILVTGTPEGVGAAMTPPRFLRAGDVVDVQITSIGTLSNPVADEVR